MLVNFIILIVTLISTIISLLLQIFKYYRRQTLILFYIFTIIYQIIKNSVERYRSLPSSAMSIKRRQKYHLYMIPICSCH